jgi:hypothetical protein
LHRGLCIRASLLRLRPGLCFSQTGIFGVCDRHSLTRDKKIGPRASQQQQQNQNQSECHNDSTLVRIVVHVIPPRGDA